MADYVAGKLAPQFRVLTAPDGKKALECIEKEGLPGVIVTDLVMPEMDGFNFCREVKKNRRTANIPILVISAMPEDEAKILSLEYGADAFLKKPFTYELLETTIRGLIRNRERISNHYSAYPVTDAAGGMGGAEEKPFTYELLETTIRGLIRNRERISSHYSAYPVTDAAGGMGGAEEKLLMRIQEYVLENIANPSLRVEHIAEAACMSKSNLLKKMKAMVDMTPAEFVLSVRLRKAQELLADPSIPISEISSRTGFASSSYFSQAFTRMYGVNPKKFRENIRNQ